VKKKSTKKKSTTKENPIDELRAFALTLPEAWEDHPWGESVVKVRKKIFVFLGHDDGTIGFSVKLPDTGLDVLVQPFAEPTGYGLGKSGWVTVRFAPGKHRPLAEMRAWIEESYRAVAPKTLVKQLDAARGD